MASGRKGHPQWRQRLAALPALLGVALLAGCASIVETTEQTITLDLEPEYATCVAQRNGNVIGSVSGTNPHLTVGKSRYALFLTCSAPGFADQLIFVDSNASRAAIAGAVTTVPFMGADFATGAFHKYPDRVAVTLVPVDPRMAFARATPVRMIDID